MRTLRGCAFSFSHLRFTESVKSMSGSGNFEGVVRLESWVRFRTGDVRVWKEMSTSGKGMSEPGKDLSVSETGMLESGKEMSGWGKGMSERAT